MLAACGEDGPDLPFVPTPEPTPEQPREVAVLAVTRPVSGEAERMAIDGATVTVGDTALVTDSTGWVTVTAFPGTETATRGAAHPR